jgi:hypothetical protein
MAGCGLQKVPFPADAALYQVIFCAMTRRTDQGSLSRVCAVCRLKPGLHAPPALSTNKTHHHHRKTDANRAKRLANSGS